MTICIAARFTDGNHPKGQGIVLATDRMMSAPHLELEFDHPALKINLLAPTTAVLAAGDALILHDVLVDGGGALARLHDVAVSDLAEHVRQRFVAVRQQNASRQILEPRGLAFENIYASGILQNLPGDLPAVLDTGIMQAALGVSLIVAGWDPTGAHIYGIEDPGIIRCFDNIGHHAIGSGSRHASMALIHNQPAVPDRHATIARVHTAKRDAENAPGVGQPTTIAVITHTGMEPLPAGYCNALDQWHGKLVENRQLPQFTPPPPEETEEYPKDAIP